MFQWKTAAFPARLPGQPIRAAGCDLLMTARLVGVTFYPNLLPGRVIDAASNRALPDPSDSQRAHRVRSSDDAVVLKSRRTAEQWESSAYSNDKRKQLRVIDSTAYDGPFRGFPGFSADAAAQYEFYARMLAAPSQSLLNVYA